MLYAVKVVSGGTAFCISTDNTMPGDILIAKVGVGTRAYVLTVGMKPESTCVTVDALMRPGNFAVTYAAWC